MVKPLSLDSTPEQLILKAGPTAGEVHANERAVAAAGGRAVAAFRREQNGSTVGLEETTSVYEELGPLVPPERRIKHDKDFIDTYNYPPSILELNLAKKRPPALALQDSDASRLFIMMIQSGIKEGNLEGPVSGSKFDTPDTDEMRKLFLGVARIGNVEFAERASRLDPDERKKLKSYLQSRAEFIAPRLKEWVSKRESDWKSDHMRRKGTIPKRGRNKIWWLAVDVSAACDKWIPKSQQLRG